MNLLATFAEKLASLISLLGTGRRSQFTGGNTPLDRA